MNKESIENLGWVQIESDTDLDLYFIYSDEGSIKYSMEVRDSHVLICRGYQSIDNIAVNIRFNGYITKIEDLKKVMSLVGVDSPKESSGFLLGEVIMSVNYGLTWTKYDKNLHASAVRNGRAVTIKRVW